MVVVLYVLAGVMAVGGLAAIYSGSDIIVMERGWTMVIAGSVVAASGVLLAGIATAVARLQGLEGEFARLSDRLARPQEPSLAPSFSIDSGRASPAERPSAPPPVVVPDVPVHRDLEVTPEPVLSSPPAPVNEPLTVETPVPVHEPPILVERASSAPEREAAPSAPEPAVAAPAVEQEPTPATVVGTYNSGGNFYIMYSDGSIEAETPAGKFRFDSLDELKEFIARGGDKARAGTPA